MACSLIALMFSSASSADVNGWKDRSLTARENRESCVMESCCDVEEESADAISSCETTSRRA